ncbi:hypothetical protein PCANC_16035 [Puccinia coronata f. sp. avenae]|uniref:Uncharacterized protein n=1 Tax=Puccinia coronata f. sp. avenae TaxID=200324 RepID=A0A2N5ULN0_9BASI|nr:hypothetical protein PCANC_16035 [Puccinia coronata f. sp. avenae]
MVAVLPVATPAPGNQGTVLVGQDNLLAMGWCLLKLQRTSAQWFGTLPLGPHKHAHRVLADNLWISKGIGYGLWDLGYTGGTQDYLAFLVFSLEML